MAKGTVKKRPTPSALRRKKAQQRIRKKSHAKEVKRSPSWKERMKKSYVASGGAEKEKNSKPKRSTGDNGDNGEVQEEVDEAKMKRLNEKDPLETQLFLKHLPLDASSEEVLGFLQRFGPVRRVLLVRNRVTGTLSGTGFVHCGSTELVEAIMKFAQQNARELSTADREELKKKTTELSRHQAKKVAHKLRENSTVVRDPFITFRNTRVTVHKVLSRTDSQETTSAQQKKKKSTRVAADDPRNLYLLQEGHITPDSPAAKGLPERYVAMLQADYEARRDQLRNTTLFVSKTRLNVRNLPKTYTENDVRRLFSEHARVYLDTHPEDLDKEKWGKYGPIKNVKLLRDSTGASKCYAFVEFVNHNVALHVLRSLNNNPTLFGDGHRLMVSFAIENTNAIQKLMRLKELRKLRENGRGDVY